MQSECNKRSVQSTMSARRDHQQARAMQLACVAGQRMHAGVQVDCCQLDAAASAAGARTQSRHGGRAGMQAHRQLAGALAAASEAGARGEQRSPASSWQQQPGRCWATASSVSEGLSARRDNGGITLIYLRLQWRVVCPTVCHHFQCGAVADSGWHAFACGAW